MPYAHSTNIDKLLEAIDQHLGRVQHAFIALIALVFAADDTSFHDPALFSPESGAQAEGRERLFSLIRMARDKGEEVAWTLDAAQTALADRGAYYGKVMAEDSPNARVAEGLDEAIFVLESAGAQTRTSIWVSVIRTAAISRKRPILLPLSLRAASRGSPILCQ
jgi:hypothetical protein